MDDVAVSSLSKLPEASGQVITRGTACSMRALRRLGTLAAIGGKCSVTGRALRRRAGHPRFAGQPVKQRLGRTKGAAGQAVGESRAGHSRSGYSQEVYGEPRYVGSSN